MYRERPMKRRPTDNMLMVRAADGRELSVPYWVTPYAVLKRRDQEGKRRHNEERKRRRRAAAAAAGANKRQRRQVATAPPR